MVKYAYDAYGNCKVVSGADSEIATLNPFRYRGYYYDRETGLYYLNARYYNPEWRRFISPDSPSALDPKSVNGLNLYAYCGNNPIGIALGSVSHSSGSIVPGMSSYASASAFSGVKGNSFADNLFSYDPTVLSTWFSYADSAFSIGSGISSIARDIKKLEHIKALEATGDVLMHLGYWINIYVAAYENYHDDSMTKQEKWVSFLVDANHITGQTVGGHFLSSVKYVGPVLAIVVPTFVDYLWSGELCILGFEIKRVSKPYIYGKTSEEWVKYWINSLLE